MKMDFIQKAASMACGASLAFSAAAVADPVINVDAPLPRMFPPAAKAVPKIDKTYSCHVTSFSSSRVLYMAAVYRLQDTQQYVVHVRQEGKPSVLGVAQNMSGEQVHVFAENSCDNFAARASAGSGMAYKVHKPMLI